MILVLETMMGVILWNISWWCFLRKLIRTTSKFRRDYRLLSIITQGRRWHIVDDFWNNNSHWRPRRFSQFCKWKHNLLDSYSMLFEESVPLNKNGLKMALHWTLYCCTHFSYDENIIRKKTEKTHIEDKMISICKSESQPLFPQLLELIWIFHSICGWRLYIVVHDHIGLPNYVLC